MQVVLAESDLPAVQQIAGPPGVDAHRLNSDTVRGDVVARGDRDAGGNRSAGRGSVALHAFEPVDYGRAPERLHLLRGQHHVVVGLTDAAVIRALVVPVFLLAGRLVERRT